VQVWRLGGRRQVSWTIPQADLESTIKEKYNLQAQIEQFKDDISSMKETHADEVLRIRNCHTWLT
jgi:hypothetical protein